MFFENVKMQKVFCVF